MYRLICAVISLFLVGGAAEANSSSNFSSFLTFDTTASFSTDSTTGKLSQYALDSISVVDSVSLYENDDEKTIAELLETARIHYNAALQAQAAGDSAASSNEFEDAIVHLNELSYYPDIDSNADFNELTKSVIEDYEKYIATIDSLGPNSSIFALREKLNLDIEQIDITNIQIPQSLIPKTQVPLDINEFSKRAISFFMGKGRVHMENWIYRSGKYFPAIERIFKEEGMPTEIAHLAMCESGLNPVARSWAKAVGMWQFMKSTGSLYGLRSNYWYDERRDFEKATRAAARHMKDLYAEFNDWHLVFVAYNAGSGWVRRGIRRTGETDFWGMRRRLPRETRNYVPQYIAVTLIAMRPEAFGFANVKKADSLSYEYVTVDDCVDLGILAECAGTTLDTIRELNPELTQWCTPPNYKGYQLRVPLHAAAMFAENYAKIPEDQKLDFATHVIRRGETVSMIAKKYGLQSSVILEVNKISRKARLKIGATLVIPIQSKSVTAVVEAQRKKEIADRERAQRLKEERRIVAASSPRKRIIATAEYEPAGRAKIVYTVKSGETLGHIAEWFHVRASHIRNWNNISYGRFIYPGQRLNIWVPAERYDEFKKIAAESFAEKQKLQTVSARKKKNSIDNGKDASNWINHKVRRGESLEKIAKQYDVAIADLKSWNKLRTSRINAGEYLEIYSENADEDQNQNDPAPVTVAKKTKNIVSTSALITHVVRRGETLGKIASKYSVTIAEVKKWNNLRSSKIVVGQKLKIQRESDSVEKVQKLNSRS